jgi:hypothetical protein
LAFSTLITNQTVKDDLSAKLITPFLGFDGYHSWCATMPCVTGVAQPWAWV